MAGAAIAERPGSEVFPQIDRVGCRLNEIRQGLDCCPKDEPALDFISVGDREWLAEMLSKNSSDSHSANDIARVNDFVNSRILLKHIVEADVRAYDTTGRIAVQTPTRYFGWGTKS